VPGEAQTLELRKMDPTAIFKAVEYDKVPLYFSLIHLFKIHWIHLQKS